MSLQLELHYCCFYRINMQTAYHEEALRGVSQAWYEPSGRDGLLQFTEPPIAT